MWRVIYGLLVLVLPGLAAAAVAAVPRHHVTCDAATSARRSWGRDWTHASRVPAPQREPFTWTVAALDAPATEVRYQGPYVLHHDFDTSRAINAYLDQGVQSFFVETDGGYAWMRMVPRKEATR